VFLGGIFHEVELTLPESDSTKLKIDLKSQGGGIGKVCVWVNGKEIAG